MASDRPAPVARIISGGQSGVDRAALDVALDLGLPYGGWCPRGGWAEDLTEPPGLLGRYPGLRETAEADPAVRTHLNVRDCDAVLVLRGAGGSPGTDLTLAAARDLRRPVLLSDGDVEEAVAWLDRLPIPAPLRLDVAGPRESEEPGIHRRARRFLAAVLARWSST